MSLAADLEDADTEKSSADSEKALEQNSGYASGTVKFDHEKNRGHATFDAIEVIDPDDDDPWMWILRDYFGEFAGNYEVVEGTVKIGMHEGFFKNYEISAKQYDDEGNYTGWKKESFSGNARMRRYSASIRKRVGSIPKLVQEDFEKILESAKKSPSTKRKTHHHDVAVVGLADLQLGKTQKGLGTEDNLKRIANRREQCLDWLADMKPRKIVIINPGDTVEACDGFYATQTYDVDLNNRQQMMSGLDVLGDHITPAHKIAPQVELTIAPSNHGEYRVAGGRTNTDPARDNRDLLLGDLIEKLAPHKWPNLKVNMPDEKLGDPFLASFMTSDRDTARRIGTVHGHQVRAPGNAPIIKLANWWAANMMTDVNRPRYSEGIFAENCHMMVAGHFHHLNIYTGKSRMLITLPAQDLGSEWYSTGSGYDNPAGLFCWTIDEDHPHLMSSSQMFAVAT